MQQGWGRRSGGAGVPGLRRWEEPPARARWGAPAGGARRARSRRGERSQPRGAAAAPASQQQQRLLLFYLPAFCSPILLLLLPAHPLHRGGGSAERQAGWPRAELHPSSAPRSLSLRCIAAHELERQPAPAGGGRRRPQLPAAAAPEPPRRSPRPAPRAPAALRNCWGPPCRRPSSPPCAG